MVSKESKGLLRGEYGDCRVPVVKDVRKKCIGDDAVITHRPADDIAPELEQYREQLKDVIEQEEDILSYAMFPQVAPKYFEYRRAALYQVDPAKLDSRHRIHPV